MPEQHLMLSCHAQYKKKNNRKKKKSPKHLQAVYNDWCRFTPSHRFSRCELIQRIVNWIWSMYRLSDRIIILNINLHLNAYSLHV